MKYDYGSHFTSQTVTVQEIPDFDWKHLQIKNNEIMAASTVVFD
jgi:hypothetical protein